MAVSLVFDRLQTPGQYIVAITPLTAIIEEQVC